MRTPRYCLGISLEEHLTTEDIQKHKYSQYKEYEEKKVTVVWALEPERRRG